MSLRPDDRFSRRRDRSHSRSGSRDERSRSRHQDRDRDERDRDHERERKKKASSPPRNERPSPSPAASYATPIATGAALGSMAMPMMPEMPPIPDLDSYRPHSGSLSGSRPSQPYRPLPAGSVPYPTSDFFPDPSQFDITGGGPPSHAVDSGAYDNPPYPAASDVPGSFPNIPSPGTRAPSSFYPHASSTARETSSSKLPDAAKFYPAAQSSQRTPGSASGTHDFVPGGRPRSSSNLSVSMDRLTIGGSSQPTMGGGLPPPSPLLEAYRGTYQSASPMVAPMAHFADSDMSDMESLSSGVATFKPAKSSSKNDKSDKKDKHSKSDKSDKRDKASRTDSDKRISEKTHRPRKSVTLYEPATDATVLCKALSHSHASNIDTDTITRILPELTHDQILALRKEYKTVAKVNGKGINLSKHLKLKLTGNYGKVAFVTALGRWESEGHWANFFYQSHGSRRELLIESLMGRTNAEVRAIKDDFRDKRYADDLRKMIERELRADKFRAAVLMVLEERRQEETDPLGDDVVRRDVQTLAACLRTTQGGESAMLEIVVRRSDAHLRLVLATFERELRINFAREALKRSGNLVGEVLAHILNGVINRPARDALLLKHAIQDIAAHNRDEELRYELLISRLVRFHWDRSHLERVKREYAVKNGRKLEDDIAKATKGDFRDFMVELCEPRR